MEEKEVFNGIAGTLTDRPFTFTVPVRWIPDPLPPAKKRPLIDRILRRKVQVDTPVEVEKERTFTIYPSVVANMYRIAGRAALLPKEIMSGILSESVLPLIPVCMPDMIYIIASAIQNNHLEPDQELITFIERNFNQNQIFEALYESIEGIGLQTFLNSIVLARGTVSILKPKTSPEDGSELIASHTAV